MPPGRSTRRSSSSQASHPSASCENTATASDDVEEAIGMRKGRLRPAEGGVARRAQMPLHPGDRWGIDVATVDLGSLGLGQQVAQQPARAAAEIQHATAGGQAAGQDAEQIGLQVAPHAVEVARPILARDAPVDVCRHLPRRHGWRGRIGHGASIAPDLPRRDASEHGHRAVIAGIVAACNGLRSSRHPVP